MEASHSTGLAEHMSIELPGGIATVKAPDDMEDMDTYLLFVTGTFFPDGTRSTDRN